MTKTDLLVWKTNNISKGMSRLNIEYTNPEILLLESNHLTIACVHVCTCPLFNEGNSLHCHVFNTFLASSDCCQLPCHSNRSIIDGSLLLKCSAWADHTANTAGQTWIWGSTDTGTMKFNISTVKSHIFQWFLFLGSVNFGFYRMQLRGLNILSQRLWSSKKLRATVLQSQMPRSPVKVI